MRSAALKPAAANDAAASCADSGTVTYTGTVLAAAQVRWAQIDADGHMAPALCMKVLLDEPPGALLHLEQHFPTAATAACRAAAHRHRAGTRVTVAAPVLGLRINARFVEHIHIINPIKDV